MKRSISILLAAVLLALTLCGCGAAQETKQVKVTVTLADADHELKEDAVVSANKRFSNSISHSGRWRNGGNYDYIFEVPEKLDTLYVQPPVIYHTVEVDPISAAVPQSMIYLMANAPRTNGAGKNGIEFRDVDGTKWFTVDSVIVGGGGGGVIVRFHTATEDAIPQKMLLQLGNSEPMESDKRISFYSQTSMQNGHFSFLFLKKAEGDIFSEEEILAMLTGAEVTLTVEQAKVKIPAEEMQVTSKDVNIVVEGNR